MKQYGVPEAPRASATRSNREPDVEELRGDRIQPTSISPASDPNLWLNRRALIARGGEVPPVRFPSLFAETHDNGPHDVTLFEILLRAAGMSVVTGDAG